MLGVGTRSQRLMDANILLKSLEPTVACCRAIKLLRARILGVNKK